MRSRQKIKNPDINGRVTEITIDLLREDSLSLPPDIEAAYLLVNTMPSISSDLIKTEALTIGNLVKAVKGTACRQVIYLTGIVSGQQPVFLPQLYIEQMMRESGIPYTILRASMIIGNGSAYFEILQQLTKRSPFILSSNWINARYQPIAVDDVILYLQHVLQNREAMNRIFEIGGPEVLSYKKMIKIYAEMIKLKRYFLTFPFNTPPAVASYWLKTLSSVPYETARALIERMRFDMTCSNKDIESIAGHQCLNYTDSLQRAS